MNRPTPTTRRSLLAAGARPWRPRVLLCWLFVGLTCVACERPAEPALAVGTLAPPVAVTRLGTMAGYEKVSRVSKAVLPERDRASVPLVKLPPSRVHLAAATVRNEADDAGEGAACTVELHVDGNEPVLVATLELPPAEARWVEAEIATPAVASGSLEFACDGPAVFARPLAVPRPATPAAPLIVLISLDTLRADYVDGFGGDLQLTPKLGAFADEGLRLQNATSEGAWTLASHYSLLFSRIYGFAVDDKPLTSLAQSLSDRGFVTAGLTGGGFMGAAFNYHLGFDHYGEYNTAADDLPLVLADARPTIERFADVPTFLFLHTFSVHEMPPNEIAWQKEKGVFTVFRPDAEEVGIARDFYAKVLRRTDAELGAFFDELREIQSQRPVLVVIVSDHGEAFDEHDNFRHGFGDRHVTLHDEVTRVPIIVWAPGLVEPARSSEVPTMLSDVAPSILAATGTTAPASMRGRDDWSSWAHGDGRAAALAPGGVSHTDGVWSYRTDRMKLIAEMTRRRGRPGFELYDLTNDPGEHHNLASNRPDEVRALRDALLARLVDLGVPPRKGGLPRCTDCAWQARDRFWSAALEDRAREGAVTPGAVDEETLQRLRDLGYTD